MADTKPTLGSNSDVPPPRDTWSCDVLVVGGGIHGTGIAQAAAAAGYSVLLIEQSKLAAGTSSKSSKLIHGGLRYLEQWHLGLVREGVRERELLCRLAPTLVKRHPFHIPVYPATTRRPAILRAGLSVYALLAGLRDGTRFASLPRTTWDNLDGLTLDQLQAVYRYYDAQTDDAQLTAAVMYSATTLGATLLCPARFLGAKITTDRCAAEFMYNNERITCFAQAIVNAAGPWANQILATITPQQPPFPVDLVQGAHIEVAGKITQGSYYLEAPQDRRAVFVMPWHSHTLVGTTEYVFTGDPGSVTPLPTEIEYLSTVFSHYFPERTLQVLDAWAGLRVLPRAAGRAFQRSRETQLPVDQPNRPRLISVFGGKLTGYRVTAQKVLQKLTSTLPRRSVRGRTDQLPLVEPPENWKATKDG